MASDTNGIELMAFAAAAATVATVVAATTTVTGMKRTDFDTRSQDTR